MITEESHSPYEGMEGHSWGQWEGSIAENVI